MKSLTKVLLLVMAVSALLSASPLCSNYSTLDQFLTGGFQCQVDNILFSNFVYTGSMTGSPADTAGPPLNPSLNYGADGYVTPNLVSVLTDQGGTTGSLQFRAVWEINGPDTDPTSTPPPGGD